MVRILGRGSSDQGGQQGQDPQQISQEVERIVESKLQEVLQQELAKVQLETLRAVAQAESGQQAGGAVAGQGGQNPAPDGAAGGGETLSSGMAAAARMLQEQAEELAHVAETGQAGAAQAAQQPVQSDDPAAVLARMMGEVDWDITGEITENLTKLKQVIQETQAIADKLEALVGTSEGQRQGGQGQQ